MRTSTSAMARHWVGLAIALVTVCLLAASCGDSDGDTDEPDATETPASAEAPDTDEPDATEPSAGTEVPDEVNIAVVVFAVKEASWNLSLIGSLDRVAEAEPHGLQVTYEVFENIAYADGERVIRELASGGEYDIILGHSTYGEAIAAVKDDFPDMLFAYSGSGNEPSGGNGYWIDVLLHEPAYVAGVAAALMSETDSIGAVAAFPFPNVNGPVNAFFDGARSVSPDITTSVTYIESWFDPAKAGEASAALIASGADVLYAPSTPGTFSPIAEGDPVLGIGDLIDEAPQAPHAIVTSTVALWDPAVSVLIDAWFDHAVNDAPYDAPLERIRFFMSEGGADIAPLTETLVPGDVAAAVMEVREQILSGEVVVELNEGPVE